MLWTLVIATLSGGLVTGPSESFETCSAAAESFIANTSIADISEIYCRKNNSSRREMKIYFINDGQRVPLPK